VYAIAVLTVEETLPFLYRTDSIEGHSCRPYQEDIHFMKKRDTFYYFYTVTAFHCFLFTNGGNETQTKSTRKVSTSRWISKHVFSRNSNISNFLLGHL